MKVNLPVVFNQLEEKNKHILLGLNTDYKYNLYNYGCTLFSLLEALQYYGKNETIETLNQKLIDLTKNSNGKYGFVKFGEYIHGSITQLYPDVQERWVLTPTLLNDAQMTDIKQALDSAYPVMVKIDYNPNTSPIDMHFLNLVDYDTTDENNMTGADPLGGKLIPMKAYFSWAKFGMRKIIESYCVISGPIAVKPAAAVVEPKVEIKPVEFITSTPEPEPKPEVPLTPPPAEPSPTVQPVNTPPEPPVEPVANAQSDVLAQVIEYLEIDKKPELTTFDNIRRRIAGIKSTSTDYWNKKEAAEKELAVTRPTITSLTDRIGNLEGELLRMTRAHKAEIEAIESTVQNPKNLKKQFEAIYRELKDKHDEYFNELVTLRHDNTLLRRDLEVANGKEPLAPIEDVKPPVTPAVSFKKQNGARENMILSILNSIKSFFRSDDL